MYPLKFERKNFSTKIVLPDNTVESNFNNYLCAYSPTEVSTKQLGEFLPANSLKSMR